MAPKKNILYAPRGKSKSFAPYIGMIVELDKGHRLTYVPPGATTQTSLVRVTEGTPGR